MSNLMSKQKLASVKHLDILDPLASELVWVWNDLEKSWVLMQGCCAVSFWKVLPKRYEYWRPFEEISTPPGASMRESIDFDQQVGSHG